MTLKKKPIEFAFLLLILCPCVPASGLSQHIPGDVLYVRVPDVGAGLRAIPRAPGDHYLEYDTGTYEDRGATYVATIQRL